MPRLIRTAAVAVSLLLAGCGGLSSATSDIAADGSYNTPKQIRYSYTLKNTTGKLLEKADFWTYAPVPQTAHQKVVRLRANAPYTSKRDEYGNELLHFEIVNLPPYGMKIVSVTADLLMSPTPVSTSGSSERFLRPEPHIESDDPRIVTLAKTLSAASPELRAQSTYKWVADHLFSEGYIAEDRGALYALLERKGDCTEYAYLLTALYRAQGIPSRAIGGYVFTGNDVVKPTDYHNWTELYAQGAWQIADAQKGAFREKQVDYVAMRRIVPDTNNPFNAQRFSFAGAGLEVSMN